MHAINEQEGYIAEAARLIGNTRPARVSIADADAQHDDPAVASSARPVGGIACAAVPRRGREPCAPMALRRAATNASGSCGLAPACGTTTGFYSALEDRHGAVFVWSNVHAICRPQYIRELHDRPMHALASRVCSMNEVLHLPPWL
jgi:hypothetical protein